MQCRVVVVLALVAACSARDEAAPSHETLPAPPRRAPEPTVATPPNAPAPPPAPSPAPASKTAARADRIELTFMGDIMFGGYFDDHYDPQEVELHDPLADIDALIASDLPFANFETTITRKLPNGGKDHDGKGHKRFVTIPERVAILPRHHITTVTLANNHQFDNDLKGLTETPEILRELGIQFIGAARTEAPRFRVETLEVKGWKIGFIPATTELNHRPRPTAPMIAFTESPTLAKELVPLIQAARADHDLVIVQVHWGIQYSDVPEKWQVAAAHAFIDAGADAVIGHHPHVLQAIERYRGGLVAYSLGNFVFPNGKEPVRQTGILRLGFTAKPDAPRACLDTAAFHPAMQDRQPITHPVPASGKLMKIIEQRLFALSAARPFATTWRVDGDRFTTEPACARPK
ncbi:MAG TPA: CapA family protein [Kofleriaceae bacterium]|nr:CapA family protein [Kofleriaceae bacterium]